jgi:hypothetical protein
MEYQGSNGTATMIGSGFHNNLTATLGSIWYRFYMTNIRRGPASFHPATMLSYLGSNSNTTEYFGGAQNSAAVDFDGNADNAEKE